MQLKSWGRGFAEVVIPGSCSGFNWGSPRGGRFWSWVPDMTAKIAASSSWPLLAGASGLSWGKEPGAVLRSKAETCRSALKPPNLRLRWEKQIKPPLQSP